MKRDKNRPDIIEEQKETLQMMLDDEQLQHDAHKRFRFNRDELEFTNGELSRLDDIYGATNTLLQVLSDGDNSPEFDMALIGPVADVAIQTLKDAGYTASYPAMVYNDDDTIEYDE